MAGYPNDQAQAGGAIPVYLAAAPSGSTSGTVYTPPFRVQSGQAYM